MEYRVVITADAEEDLEGFSAPMVEHVKRVVKIYQE